MHDAAERRARGYVWETFRPGNFVALRHGLYSERVLAPLAAQLAEHVLSARPDLAAPQWQPAVSAWARAEVRAMLAFAAIDAAVAAGTTPAPSLMQQHGAAERLAIDLRRTLGLDPAAAARLVREQADAARSTGEVLRSMIAEGRAGLESRTPPAPLAIEPARDEHVA